MHIITCNKNFVARVNILLFIFYLFMIFIYLVPKIMQYHHNNHRDYLYPIITYTFI